MHLESQYVLIPDNNHGISWFEILNGNTLGGIFMAGILLRVFKSSAIFFPAMLFYRRFYLYNLTVFFIKSAIFIPTIIQTRHITNTLP